MGYPKIACPKCDREVGNNTLRRHVESCLGKRPCPVCGKDFVSRAATCSYSCSNTHFRTGKDHSTYKAGKSNYRSMCFLHHERKCVVCGENKIVSVHHVNGVHGDNRPENLIPLCPTHHQYWHSAYRDEVESIIEEYVKVFIGV